MHIHILVNLCIATRHSENWQEEIQFYFNEALASCIAKCPTAKHGLYIGWHKQCTLRRYLCICTPNKVYAYVLVIDVEE